MLCWLGSAELMGQVRRLHLVLKSAEQKWLAPFEVRQMGLCPLQHCGKQRLAALCSQYNCPSILFPVLNVTQQGRARLSRKTGGVENNQKRWVWHQAVLDLLCIST